MTKAELGRRMSAKEFNEWEVYSQVEPFGFDLLNFIQAVTRHTLVDCHSTKTPDIKTLLFDFGKPENAPKTVEEIMGILIPFAKKEGE